MKNIDNKKKIPENKYYEILVKLMDVYTASLQPWESKCSILLAIAKKKKPGRRRMKMENAMLNDIEKFISRKGSSNKFYSTCINFMANKQ